MAVETLILRPVDVYKLGTTVYPTDLGDTPHLAVNEEIADGDATYLSLAKVTDVTNYTFTVPDEYSAKTPSAIRAVFCARKSTANALTVYGNWFCAEDSDNTTVELEIAAESYEIYTFSPSAEKLLPAWEHLLTYPDDTSTKRHIGINGAATSSNKNDNAGAYITQVYLEIDFDDGTADTPEIHVKRNGAWLGVTQQFRKVDGAWAEITAEEAKEILANNAVELVS